MCLNLVHCLLVTIKSINLLIPLEYCLTILSLFNKHSCWSSKHPMGFHLLLESNTI